MMKPIDNIANSITMKPYYSTKYGNAYCADSLEIIEEMPKNSINLIMTSPPFALVRKKKYDNVDAENYIEWFDPYAKEFYRILKKKGSLVIHLGGSWIKGKPVKSVYNFELLIHLIKKYHFYLAQDFYWYNKAKLPGPAEWTNVRRIRVKDSVEPIWWLSKFEFPKANNIYILKEYSDEMKKLLQNEHYYKPNKLRPSEHKITHKFYIDNSGAIPPNFLDFANTDSQSKYMRLCRINNEKPHPSRYPHQLSEFFIKFLTDKNDIVLDPFAGSNTTGESCEFLKRKWISIEILESYVRNSQYRF